jgi:hypothetical protein
MLEFIGGMLAGVVLGSAAAETLAEQKPEVVDSLRSGTRSKVGAIFSGIHSARLSFSKGFRDSFELKDGSPR